jgi:hypothetical protein
MISVFFGIGVRGPRGARAATGTAAAAAAGAGPAGIILRSRSQPQAWYSGNHRNGEPQVGQGGVGCTAAAYTVVSVPG